MLGTNLLDRRSKPERIADQAWEHLTNTMSSAGDSVRHAAHGTIDPVRRTGSQLTGQAGDLVSTAADEAWHRANRAYDALAGRRPGLPWGWLIGAGLLGAALGWAAGTAARAAIARAENELPAAETEPVDFVDVDRSSSTVRLDTT
ncbi:hypothetical protein [Plantactinospora sp. CA-290183]|uniref:hypothetical protein n=1 Tax=Plantactinospora sp. CA-290183 TaxID=3240006 RepID=UPI003D947BA5